MEQELSGIVLRHRAAVYRIIHQPTGATYVGKTKDWLVRLRQHRRALLNGVHSNAPLQALASRDGLEWIIFEEWWRAPKSWNNAQLREAEDAAMRAVLQMGLPLLNVLRPATQPGRSFSLGPGGRWSWC